MKYNVTFIAKIVVYAMVFAVLVVLVILMPELAREEAASNPAVHHVDWPYFVGAWILSIPIFVASHQTLKLISYVDKQEALANKSIKALQNIKICAIAFGILILLAAAATVTAAKIVSPQEDTPPVMLIGFVLAFTASIIATSTAVLQKLLQNAIVIKSENDLIV